MGTSNYGRILPHGDILWRLSLNDKNNKSEQDKRAEKEEIRLKQSQDQKEYKFDKYYQLSGFHIAKADLQAYIDGDKWIPGERLTFGYRFASYNDERLVRNNLGWQLFARKVYNKLINQLNGVESKSTKFSPKADPNSWSQLARQRRLIVKDILIDNKTETARLLFCE